MTVKPKTKEYKMDVHDANGKKVDKFELNKKIFDGEVNTALLHEATIMYAACRRQGTASTKTRAEVRGGGKKPWRQKGTGRARFGSIRNPVWRGGGIAFGPRPRDYSYEMPKKARLNAVKSALNAKLEDKQFVVVDDIKIDEPKTKKLVSVLKKFKINGKTLLVVDKVEENIKRASRNLKALKVMQHLDVCSDDILRHEYFLVTKSALQKLTKRLSS